MSKISISPSVDVYVSVVMMVIAGLASGQLPAFPGVPDVIWGEIKTWSNTILIYATFFSVIFPALSSAKPGPMVQK